MCFERKYYMSLVHQSWHWTTKDKGHGNSRPRIVYIPLCHSHGRWQGEERSIWLRSVASPRKLGRSYHPGPSNGQLVIVKRLMTISFLISRLNQSILGVQSPAMYMPASPPLSRTRVTTYTLLRRTCARHQGRNIYRARKSAESVIQRLTPTYIRLLKNDKVCTLIGGN